MNILMLNPPFKGRFSREQRSPAITKSGTLYYPVWLAYATGVLEKEGFSVKLVDAPANGLEMEDVVKITQEVEPELVVIDTSTPSIYNDIKVGEILKSNIKNQISKIVLVGPHVSATPEETLKLSDKIDIVCRGEYDYTIREIAKELQNAKCKMQNAFDKIQGISFRNGEEIIHNPDRPYIENLDEIPFVSGVYKRHLNIYNYFFAASQYPEVQIFTGRGCPFHCVFCVYPQVFQGKKLRLRTPENVVSEMEHIKTNLPEVKEVVIEDDTFTVIEERVRIISKLIIERGLKMAWNVNTRVNLSLDTMKLMKKAGCRLLIPGFESGNQKILDNMKKDIKVEQSMKFMKNARGARLLVHGCFMIGNRGETKKTIKETIEFAKRLNPDTAQFFPVMVYPGTEIYEWVKKEKYLITTDYNNWLTNEGLHNCVIDLPGLKSKELVEFCDKARREFYIRPSYIVRKAMQIVKSPTEGKRVLKAAKTFTKYIVPFRIKK